LAFIIRRTYLVSDISGCS